MLVIKPASDLRNYNEVLTDVREGSPVFLTKNGRGCYAILDIRDFDRVATAIYDSSDYPRAPLRDTPPSSL